MILPTRTAAELTGAGLGLSAYTATGAPEILGAQPGILLAAYAGALFGLAYTKPETWGRLLAIPAGSTLSQTGWFALRAGGLLFTLTMFAFLATWTVATAPHVPGAGWTGGLPPLPFAGLLAFGGQYLLPVALNSAGEWIKRKGTG